MRLFFVYRKTMYYDTWLQDYAKLSHQKSITEALEEWLKLHKEFGVSLSRTVGLFIKRREN